MGVIKQQKVRSKDRILGDKIDEFLEVKNTLHDMHCRLNFPAIVDSLFNSLCL